MSWDLSLRVTYWSNDGGLTCFPAVADEPCYSFDSLDELVEFLEDLGEVAGLGGLDEFARQVDREGEVIERTLSLRRRKDRATVQKAVDRVRRQNRAATANDSEVNG